MKKQIFLSLFFVAIFYWLMENMTLQSSPRYKEVNCNIWKVGGKLIMTLTWRYFHILSFTLNYIFPGKLSKKWQLHYWNHTHSLWEGLLVSCSYRIVNIFLCQLNLPFVLQLCFLFWVMQDWKLEKKSSDIFVPNNSGDSSRGGSGGNGAASNLNVDEEAPLLSTSRLSHIGRSHLIRDP